MSEIVPVPGTGLDGHTSAPDQMWSDDDRVVALLDGMQEGVVIMDAGAGIVAANPAAEQILGLSRAQLLGRSALDPLWQSIHRDGTPWAGSDHPSVRCLRTGQPQRDQIMGVQPEGALRWLKVNAVPVPDGDSQRLPRAVICTFTEVNRAGTPDDLPTIGRSGGSANELMVRLDRYGRVTRMGPSSLKMLGFEPDEMVATKAAEWMHPADAAAVIDDPALLRRPIATYRIRHADGTHRHIETSTFWHRDEQGHVEIVDIVGRDVTERQVAQQALRQAEERFRVIFDMGPIGRAIVLPEGRFMRVNDCLARLVLADASTMLGRVLDHYIHDADRQTVRALLKHTISGQDESQTREVRLKTGGDDLVHTALTASVVREDGPQPTYLIVQFDDLTARKQSQDALSYQTNHDALTALPNRKMLLDRLGAALERAKEEQHSVAVLFCDVDRFKRINESLGHTAGDLLLIEIARRMRGAIRRSDTVGRLSGDEFLVICEQLNSRDDARARAQRIRAITDSPIIISGHTLQVSLSIGVAFAGRADQPATVLRQADTAMNEAKTGGRGRLEVFTERLRERARQQLQIETDLRIAIATGQLRLHHQPIVHLLEGTIIGREALVRWQHPEKGLLAPAAFLDVAEETDLIVEVGGWVLAEACRQAVFMRRHVGDFRLGVNVSALELARPDFRARVERALADSGLPAELLVLELTETSLLQASTTMLIGIRALAAQGVRLAIDDFGTGYSSLTYLQKLPVRIVKIDQSFIADITSDPKLRAMTRAVVDLGAALHLDVVAEGVETAEQAQILIDLGCHMAQGFHFGRPAPAESHINLVSEVTDIA